MNIYKMFSVTRESPVIYDNDAHADVYTDELLLSLSSAGEINLKGFITSSPANRYVNLETFELDYLGRDEIIKKARCSGMKNLPLHYRGPATALFKPDSGKIEDTVPVDTPGSRFIVREAKKATAENPLLIVMGGPLTVAADAFLLDNSIADKIVIGWLGGSNNDMNDYNGWVDPWAAYIVLSRLKLVQFSLGVGLPLIPKSGFEKLDRNEFVQWMMDKALPHVNLPGQSDGDCQPVISLIRDDYVKVYKRVSFSHWVKGWHDADIPAFKTDPSGSAVVITEASPEVATESWWESISNKQAYGEFCGEVKSVRPFYAIPLPIGRLNRIEAEDFDHGEPGLAYCSGEKYENSVYRSSGIKILKADDLPGGYNIGAGGGFCISGLKEGDFLRYTLDIKEQAEFWNMDLRVASHGPGGFFRIEFNGVDKTGSVQIPDTAGEFSWLTISIGNIRLEEGINVMRLVVDKSGSDGHLGNINYFQLY